MSGTSERRVDDAEQEDSEPDYRFTLANERTFLAGQRTAFGLPAAAIAVVQLVPDLAVSGACHVIGALLAALAIIRLGRDPPVEPSRRGDAPRPPASPTPVVRPGFVHTRMTEGLKPAPLSATPDAVAAVVVDAVRTRKELVWAPAPLRFGSRSCSGRVSSPSPSPPSH